MNKDNINIDVVLDHFFRLETKDVDYLVENLIAVKAALQFKGISFKDGKLDKTSLNIADSVVNATKETLTGFEEYLENKGGKHNAKN